jgi:hypothetical protein
MMGNVIWLPPKCDRHRRIAIAAQFGIEVFTTSLQQDDNQRISSQQFSFLDTASLSGI